VCFGGYVQAAGGPNHYPLFRPYYTLGLDSCLYRGNVKWKEKLALIGWSSIDNIFSFFYYPCLFRQRHEQVPQFLPQCRETQKNIAWNLSRLLYDICCQELMKSLQSNGS
jgi:hypothetical protein